MLFNLCRLWIILRSVCHDLSGALSTIKCLIEIMCLISYLKIIYVKRYPQLFIMKFTIIFLMSALCSRNVLFKQASPISLYCCLVYQAFLFIVWLFCVVLLISWQIQVDEDSVFWYAIQFLNTLNNVEMFDKINRLLSSKNDGNLKN